MIRVIFKDKSVVVYVEADRVSQVPEENCLAIIKNNPEFAGGETVATLALDEVESAQLGTEVVIP